MSKMKELHMDNNDDNIEQECGECSEEEMCSDCKDYYIDQQMERDFEYERELRAGIFD